MKATVYTIEDQYSGMPLIIEGEVIEFDDMDSPAVIINTISHGETGLELWPFSDKYIVHLKNKIYQEWCMESKVTKHHGKL